MRSQLHDLQYYLLVGVLFTNSFYSFGLITAPCFYSRCLLPRCGKLYSAQSMFLVQALAVIIFGLAKIIHIDALFISFSMLARFMQGFAESVIVSSALMMSSTYYNHKASYQTAFMMGYQLSELLGPIWGGLLYNQLGYTGIFFMQAAVLILCSVLLSYFRQYEREYPYIENYGSSQVGYRDLLKVPGVFFGFLAFIFGESFYMCIDPILPFKLSLQFGFDEHKTGIFFFNFTILVALVTFTLLFIPNKWNKTLFIITGSFIIVLGSILTGPSTLFRLPNSLTIMRYGLWIAGIGRALMQSFSSGYMEMHGNHAYPGNEQQVSAKVGMMLNMGYALGVLVIQMGISIAYRFLNFSRALQILGGLYLLNALGFTTHAILKEWKEKKQANDEAKVLLL